MEWSSGVGTGKECMASGDPVKPLTSLLAHKQESALCHLLKTFVDRLLQEYFRLQRTHFLGPIAPNHLCRYQPLLKPFHYVE